MCVGAGGAVAPSCNADLEGVSRGSWGIARTDPLRHVAPVRGKNWHFDVRPRERNRDDEVAWLVEYGATVVADHRGIYGPGSGWVTLADPEGNQLCVLRSRAELAAQEQAHQQTQEQDA